MNRTRRRKKAPTILLVVSLAILLTLATAQSSRLKKKMTQTASEVFGDKDSDDAYDAGDELLKKLGKWFPKRRWEPDARGYVPDD